jgi:hypothetical protein
MPVPTDPTPAGRPVSIRPDYAGATIPPNIAPLNFTVEADGTAFHVAVRGDAGEPFEAGSPGPGIAFPQQQWRRLLEANRGGKVYFDVSVRGDDGAWASYEPLACEVAKEPVDPYLVVRELSCVYEVYVRMKIRQRCLEDFSQCIVARNEEFDDGCVNCHTFLNNDTDKWLIHMRSGKADYGVAMMLAEGGRVRKVNTRTDRTPRPAAFASWHPSGKAVAFSINWVRQFFHAARTEIRDGIDMTSDIAVFVLDGAKVTSTPKIALEDHLETWPAWSADGKYLYFSRCRTPWVDLDYIDPERYRDAMYDLMRIRYDVDSGEWGEVETALASADTGLSITLPRFSPDGRFLVFCMSEYSTFPTFQPSADLYIMDLADGTYRRMECNSDQSESWHSWSSNSRWLAISSKRDDGLFLRTYLSYVDEEGRSRKPFPVPQRDPGFYDSYIKVRQLPELIKSPVAPRGEELLRVLRSDDWVNRMMPVTGASPPPNSPAANATRSEPWLPAAHP